MKKCYDISTYTNNKWDYNWYKNEGLSSLIIRLGYGGDIPKQDDNMWKSHVAKCEQWNIPYSLYLYSYSPNMDYIQSDINHSLRIARQCNPKAIFYDVEDKAITAGYDLLTKMIAAYCKGIQNAGYAAGWYASDYWTKARFNPKAMPAGTLRWKAAWDYRPPDSTWDIWQYASKSSYVGGYDCNYYPDNGVYDKLMSTKPTPPDPPDPPTPPTPPTPEDPPENWLYTLTYPDMSIETKNAIIEKFGQQGYERYLKELSTLKIKDIEPKDLTDYNFLKE